MNASIPPKYFENGGIAGMLKALEDRDTRQRISEEMQEMGTYDNFYINAGGFEGMYFSGCPKTPDADGKSVAEYAQIVGKNGFDTLFDVLLENEGKVNGVFHSISEEDNCLIIKDENATIGTDGSCRSLNEQTHPRTFGAFPRAICHYVRDKKLMSLEAMVRKLTGFAAERMGLERKGLIKEQYDADLVVFSYDNLKDSASFTQSTLLSDGIEYVIVNGKIAYTDKQMTPVRNGRLLYHIR
jgi:N-acyl-D-amino-acid deacylase